MHITIQYKRAIADYDQALLLDPSRVAAYYERGLAYYYLDQNKRAIDDFDQAIRLDPSRAGAYSGRGLAYHDLEQYDRAIADFDQAIRLDPKRVAAYSGRGKAYLALNKTNGCADLKKACTLGTCGDYETAQQSKVCR